MVFLIIFAVLVVACISYVAGRKRGSSSEMTQEELLDAVKNIQELKVVCEMSEDYKKKCAQLDCLKEMIHDSFFFSEYKNPRVMYDSMIVRMEAYENRTYDVVESKAVAKLIADILKDVNEEWFTRP